jgi:hypothetical protein
LIAASGAGRYHCGMQLYLFASHGQPSVSAFTADAAGTNLPAQFAPWHAVNAGQPIPLGSRSSPIATAVQREGYYLLAAGRHAPCDPSA